MDLDFAKYLNTPGYYKDHFKLDVAKFLGIDKDRVIIFNSYQFGGDGTLTVPSGTVFDLYIENDPDAALARSLRTKLQDQGQVCTAFIPVFDVRISEGDACKGGGHGGPISARVTVPKALRGVRTMTEDKNDDSDTRKYGNTIS